MGGRANKGKTDMPEIGKREFLQHASQYLKRVEQSGEPLTITHHNQPRVQLVAVKSKTVRHLSGKITFLKVKGSIHKPVLKGFDRW